MTSVQKNKLIFTSLLIAVVPAVISGMFLVSTDIDFGSVPPHAHAKIMETIDNNDMRIAELEKQNAVITSKLINIEKNQDKIFQILERIQNYLIEGNFNIIHVAEQ